MRNSTRQLLGAALILVRCTDAYSAPLFPPTRVKVPYEKSVLVSEALVGPLKVSFRVGLDPLSAQLAFAGASLQPQGAWMSHRHPQRPLANDPSHTTVLMTSAGGEGSSEGSPSKKSAFDLRVRMAPLFSHALHVESNPQHQVLRSLDPDSVFYEQIGYGGLERSDRGFRHVNGPETQGAEFIDVDEREAVEVPVPETGRTGPQLVSLDFFTCIPAVLRGRDSTGRDRLFLFHFQAMQFIPGQSTEILIDFLPESVKRWENLEIILMPREGEDDGFDPELVRSSLNAKAVAVFERPADINVSMMVNAEGVALMLHENLINGRLLEDPNRLISNSNFSVIPWAAVTSGHTRLAFNLGALDLIKTVVVFPPAGERVEGLPDFFARYAEAQAVREVFNRVVKRVLHLEAFDILQPSANNAVVDSVQRHVLHLAHQIALWEIFQKNYGVPAGFVGISRGAGAAYYAAGVMTLEQAAEWAARNAQFNQLASDDERLQNRRMAVVRGLNFEDLQALLKNYLGFVNIRFARDLFTVSAPASQFTALKAAIRTRKGLFSPLELQHASHDANFASLSPLWEEYQAYLDRLEPALKPPKHTVWSQLGGHALNSPADIIQEQKRQTVDTLQWEGSMHHLYTQGIRHYFQLGSVKAAALERQRDQGIIPEADVRAAYDPVALRDAVTYEEQMRAQESSRRRLLQNASRAPYSPEETQPRWSIGAGAAALSSFHVPGTAVTTAIFAIVGYEIYRWLRPRASMRVTVQMLSAA